MSLHGKVAIVTGASREIGAGMAEALAGAGAAVLLAHRGEAALAAEVVDRIVRLFVLNGAVLAGMAVRVAALA